MFDDLSDLYQQVILDHCKHPRHFRDLPQASCAAHVHSPRCGDQLTVSHKIAADDIKDASSAASGCCTSKAAASRLTGPVKRKAKPDAQKLLAQAHEMVTSGQVPGDV